MGTIHAADLSGLNFASPPPEIQRVAVTGYADADSLGGRTLYGEGTLAPFSGIYESGLRFRVTGDASWYRFITNDYPRTLGSGRYLEGAFLGGYGIYVPGFNVVFLGGPAFGQSVNEGVTTDRWGIKGVISAYATPTDQSMAAASISYSSGGKELQVQAKAGLKLIGDFYVGPETKFVRKELLASQTQTDLSTPPQSSQTSITTLRLGVHLSALTIGATTFVGISGGWANDQQLGSGYYGSVYLYQPF
jgi:hypothetical protein